jgi:asparagine synthase (glutamine-hydrolysing)
MCGISGIFNYSSLDVDISLLEKMNNAQSHRGPDDEGYFYDNGIGLAHRRLSIIDISSGHQPITTGDGTVTIVFNGEIYNHKELAIKLKIKGHQFKTHSDTEVILHSWVEWGEECVHQLRGMFSFAIWDDKKKTLFIARDRLGIKPLYYFEDKGTVYFGSELKVLLQSGKVNKEFNHQAVEDYFSLGYIPEPKTIYSKVSKLKPGHFLLLKQGKKTKIIQHEYWDLQLNESSEQKIELQEFDKRLSEAVGIRMESEVPIGAFLSGGIDSSAIVAHMASLQTTPVNTCSIGFDNKQFDELEYAKQVAEQYKTSHHTRTINEDDFELIEQIIDWYDEPFADPSSLPTFRVCELAKEKVTVVLSGDGGDELFAGYRNHLMHNNEQKIRDRFPRSVRKIVFGTLAKIYPKLDWAPRFLRAKTTFQSLAMDDIEAFHNTMSIQRKDQLNILYSDVLKKNLNGYSSLELFQYYGNKFKGNDSLKRAQYIDFKTYLPGDILTKVDRASMQHSVEVRVPLLDHKFVEWAFNIDSSKNIVGSETKAEFKKQLEKRLPNDILYRKKMGFCVPLCDWFRGPLSNMIQTRLTSEVMKESKLFNMVYIEKIIKEHISGLKNNDTALWSLLVFSSFLEKNSGQNHE